MKITKFEETKLEEINFEDYLEFEDDIIPIGDFLECCRANFFVDDDGYGEMLLEDGTEVGTISPSDTCKSNWGLPKGVVSVNWFNK